MCNIVDNPRELRRKKGKAWKLFSLRDSKLFPLLYGIYKGKDADGWIDWDESYTRLYDKGFCLISTFRMAKKAKRYWCREAGTKEHTVIREVEYEKGIERGMANQFLFYYTPEVLLVERFRAIGGGLYEGK